MTSIQRLENAITLADYWAQKRNVLFFERYADTLANAKGILKGGKISNEMAESLALTLEHAAEKWQKESQKVIKID